MRRSSKAYNLKQDSFIYLLLWAQLYYFIIHISKLNFMHFDEKFYCVDFKNFVQDIHIIRGWQIT